MSFFSEREKAFEGKYRMDQETEFKITVRRDRLLGLWAAAEIGLSGDAAQAYALSVVDMEFSARHQDVAAKVLHDFTERGLNITEHKVRREMDRLTEIARQQIMEQAAQA